MKLTCLAAVALLVLSETAFAQEGAQLTTARLREPQQRALFQPLADQFKLRFAAATGAFRVDNAAALTLQVDKGAQPFLSTLPAPGSAQFLTALKPCGIVAPHIHLRATEIYSVIYGTLNAGIAQENGAAQNITFTVAPGEAVVVPQGLLHAQTNSQCSSVALFQSFNNADPGSLTMGNALAALGAVSPGLLGATNIQATSTGLGAFALDAQCLQRCNLPSNGGTLDDLPENIKVMFGLTGAAPSSPSPSASPSPSSGSAAVASASASASATAGGPTSNSG
jgi:oxalate decarboxylase/phosphoglucose isomerase-like protein (cupin superfamily)